MSYAVARNNVNFVISLASLAWSCQCQFVFLCLSAYWVLSFIYLKKVSCLSLLGVFFVIAMSKSLLVILQIF